MDGGGRRHEQRLGTERAEVARLGGRPQRELPRWLQPHPELEREVLQNAPGAHCGLVGRLWRHSVRSEITPRPT